MTFALIALGTSAFAEPAAEHSPGELLDFLKPEMHVAMGFREGTSSVTLSILEADEYAVAIDIASLGGVFVDAELLATNHKIVRTRLDAYLTKLEQQTSGGAGKPIRVYPLRGSLFGTIRRVGSDYVLVDYLRFKDGQEQRVRVAINKIAISRIYLDGDPIEFSSR